MALGTAAFVALTFAILLPYMRVQLPVIPAFIPVVQTIVFFTGLIAAAFLFSEYKVQPQLALLMLASTYLAAGLFALFQSFAFPYAYSPTGLFGAGQSTAGWLIVAWRTTFALGILAYALFRLPRTRGGADRHAAMTIAITGFCVAAGVCLVTWVIAIAEPYLPPLILHTTAMSAFGPIALIPAIVLSLAAVVVILIRPLTTLNLWLVVALLAGLPDLTLPRHRFELVFYAGRACDLISSGAVLMALLTEASILYARLATARALQKQEEAGRVSSVEAAMGTLAHELRQPLSAIGLDAQSGTRLLGDDKPESTRALGEVLQDIKSDVRRANDIIDRVRGFVTRAKLTLDVLDINKVVANAVKLMSEEAASRKITVVARLSGENPIVAGDRTQVTQVLVNLLVNGMDAMNGVSNSNCRLIVETAKHGGDVVVSVRDCGRGIAAENIAHLFDPFYTTRGSGMGLGLYISRAIVTAHGGRIWAENNKDRGATFSFALPEKVKEAQVAPIALHQSW